MAAENQRAAEQTQTQTQGGCATDNWLLNGYQCEDFYDESIAPDGSARPHSGPLLERVGKLTPAELRRRQAAADRALMQLGITFNVYGAKEGTERIIPFDVLPRMMAGSEWDWIERGLKQRIFALNKFIDDLYHNQHIMRDKVIPEQVIGSAASLRQQCVGIDPPQGIWCHITGTDLVRGGDGQIYVLEDNLRCPSGVSYVLQNRQLMKQTFPQLFGQLGVRPVVDYPSRLLDSLEFLMHSRTENPQAAVLTPGSYNSAYFEHSFLAQQMGVPLVEGRDLVVNDGFVYMRTTHGFERVDVLYRRIDDDFLDPQAFRKDSMLGVPGIFDAYRRGNIALANAPGCGVADDKVVYAFVPEIIKYYLKEDPILPNVPTYHCWDDKQRDHVLKNLEKLVVKPANESGGYGMLIGPQSTAEQRERFAGLIQANPRNYIAQPTLDLSRVPIFVDDHIEGRHVDLRPYIVYGREIYVLPGGLTRVALTKGSLVVNSSQGGGSKDTWVVADDPSMAEEAMLSRVAEAIYWMSRYIESAENVARFISVNLNLHLDMAGGENEQWLPLVVTAGDEKPFDERYGSASKGEVLQFLTFDRENPNSILSSVRAARENARSVREVISGEMWEHINRFYLVLKDSDASQAAIDNTASFYEQIRVSGQQFMGITDATMTHGEAWHFCRMGRLIERADKTSRILDVKYYLLLPSAADVGTTLDDVQWSALLQSASGLEMYRQRHGLISPADVVQFLILDREFPRAVLFCLTKANESLHAVSGAALGGFSNSPEQILGQLRSELAYMSAEDIIERGLHEFVDDLQDRLNRVGEAVFETFFDLRPIGPMTFSRN